MNDDDLAARIRAAFPAWGPPLRVGRAGPQDRIVEENESDIADALRTAINSAKSAGRRPTTLALQAGVSEGQISKFRKGGTTLTLKTVERLAKALDMQLVHSSRVKDPE